LAGLKPKARPPSATDFSLYRRLEYRRGERPNGLEPDAPGSKMATDWGIMISGAAVEPAPWPFNRNASKIK